MKKSSNPIVVIGSGFGGLATAIRLQSRGYQVDLVEARDMLGGRAYVYRQDGFTFDGGPTVITAPFMIDEIFEQSGRKTSDYVNIVPVDPFYRIEFHDGRSFEYNNDEAETERRVAAFAPADLDGYKRMIRRAKAIFEKGFLELSDKPFLKFTDMLPIAADLVRLQSHKTVFQFVSQYVKDPLLRRVFSFHPLLVGGNPFQTTSIYALIHYLERQWGVHYVMGGTGALVSALGRLFEELGGQIHLNSPVSQITVENGRATGVETANGLRLPASAVVSNADVANTYRKMLPPEVRRKYTDRRLERMRYSMGLYVIYFGTRKQYPNIRHHTIILSPTYRELLDDIFNKKVLSDEFSIYLHRPSATDPRMAPDGCDCFYALVPVPNQLSGIDWATHDEPFRRRILEFLESHSLPGLTENLATVRTLTPLGFETDLNSFRGSGFSFEPIFTQSAWFRPHNQSEDIPNLYFAGAGTHPGAGVPGVLSSAKIAEKLICANHPN
ncbi:MAG: phytoene desaturase [Bryobacteraceae bacterium]|nr:phytoene desaturase [Bryobacteraceae bacterium]